MADDTQLYEAVSQVLARKPGSSMQEIATAASISRTTLHRAFGDRNALVEQISSRALEECERIFDDAGIDDAPVLEALERLLDATLAFARAYVLLFTDPHVSRVPALVERIERLDERLGHYFERGQSAGAFRPDLPPHWLAYSVGGQFEAMWWAITDGHVGQREARRLLRATVLGGIAVRASTDDPTSGSWTRP